MVAGECWPAVKIPSMSDTWRPASRAALVIASTCRVSWLLPGSVPISSLSSTPTMQAELLSSRHGRYAMSDLVRELLETDLHRHVAADLLRVRLDADQVGQETWALFQLDHGEHDGRLHLERLVQDLVGDLEGEEPAAAGRLHPADVARGAERTRDARVHEGLPAGAALGDHELEEGP